MPPFELRGLDVVDAAAVHRICAAPPVAATLGTMPTDAVSVFEARIAALDPNTSCLLGAFEGETLLGLAQLTGTPRPRIRHSARLWVAVDPAHWRRGVGDALVAALVDAADRWWGLVRLELDVIASHGAAVRLYQKHGFVVEARKRCDYRLDGALVEGLHMARIRPDWSPPPALPTAIDAPPGGPRIDASRVRFRAAEPTDAAACARLHAHLSVVDTTFQLPFQRPLDWLTRIQGGRAAGVVGLLAETEGDVAGVIALVRPQSPRVCHAATLGLSVAFAYQGRGIGDLLMSAILRVADDDLDLRRVDLEVLDDNVRARKLYERHGFEVEGITRCRGFRRGTFADGILMSRIR